MASRFMGRIRPLDMFVFFGANMAVALWVWPPYLKELNRKREVELKQQQQPLVSASNTQQSDAQLSPDVGTTKLSSATVAPTKWTTQE